VGLKRFVESAGTPMEMLYIGNTGITDEGLKSLAKKVDLDGLGLGNDINPTVVPRSASTPYNRITDAGLAHLECLEKLDFLILGVRPSNAPGWPLPDFLSPEFSK
jgi:hypothetical protein